MCAFVTLSSRFAFRFLFFIIFRLQGEEPPPLCISSSWVPSSVIRPCSRKRILSQNRVELSLWEMKTAVLPRTSSSYFSYISLSAMGSRAAVGSSRITIGASLYRALASMSFCISPPDSVTPSSSSSLFMLVRVCFGSSRTRSQSPAFSNFMSALRVKFDSPKSASKRLYPSEPSRSDLERRAVCVSWCLSIKWGFDC